MRVFKNNVLGKIFWCKREVVTRGVYIHAKILCYQIREGDMDGTFVTHVS
jgi:hypothetical protein